MRKRALYKLLVFLCLRPMEMFLNKMAYLKSQGSIKDFQMLTFLVFLAIYIYIYKYTIESLLDLHYTYTSIDRLYELQFKTPFSR